LLVDQVININPPPPPISAYKLDDNVPEKLINNTVSKPLDFQAFFPLRHVSTTRCLCKEEL
jgi:hypothetical protein